jgi:hypothetical protein
MEQRESLEGRLGSRCPGMQKKYGGTLRAESTAYTPARPNKAARSRELEAFDVLAITCPHFARR